MTSGRVSTVGMGLRVGRLDGFGVDVGSDVVGIKVGIGIGTDVGNVVAVGLGVVGADEGFGVEVGAAVGSADGVKIPAPPIIVYAAKVPIVSFSFSVLPQSVIESSSMLWLAQISSVKVKDVDVISIWNVMVDFLETGQ